MLKRLLKKTRIYKYMSNLNCKVEMIADATHNASSIEEENWKKIDELKEVVSQFDRYIKEINSKLDRIIEVCNEERYANRMLLERTKQFECINTELLMLKPTQMMKILIVGFYGAPNLGDELMLEAILAKLSKYNDVEITIMIADNSDYDVRKYSNVSFVHYAKTNMDFHILAGYFDKIIFGGGALIDDSKWKVNSLKDDCLYNILINLSVCAIKQNKEVWLMGLSSAQKIENQDYISRLNFVIENAKYVSLRDDKSLIVLKESNVDCQKIEVVDDLVYSLPNCRSIYTYDKERFCVGIVLVSYTDDKYCYQMLEQIQRYLCSREEKIKTIRFIPFYENGRCDTLKYEHLIDSFNFSKEIKVEISNYSDNYEEIVGDFEKCNLVIAMRYHASLICLKEKIKSIHVVYDVHSHYINKMDDLLNKYDAKGNSINLSMYNNDEFYKILQNVQNTSEYKIETNFEELFKNVTKKDR